jgi:DNA-binding MarR family transcriptional regulator
MTRDRQAVANALHSAAVHLLRVVRSVDAQMGVSPARASVLSILVFGGARTVGGLARAEDVRSPTMSGIVNGLEADGLVRRRSSRDDARAVVVEATAKGRRLLERGRARRTALLTELLAGATDADLDVLARAAAVMEAAVDARLGEATGT